MSTTSYKPSTKEWESQQLFFWQAVIADRDQQAMNYPQALVDQWVTLISFPEEHKRAEQVEWTQLDLQLPLAGLYC